MTRPLDRNARLPEIGEVDREGGEFWAENPFMMPGSGQNLSAFERNRVYMNLDGNNFLDASFASHADIDSDSRSAIAGDFDRDGAPDLLIGSVGGGPIRLFLNRFPNVHHRVRIDLAGTESNVRGFGSRVILRAGGQQIIRDLFPENPGMGQNPPELLIGLGAAKKIDELTVRWPTGKVQSFKELPVDSRITITEGSNEPRTAPLVQKILSVSEE